MSLFNGFNDCVWDCWWRHCGNLQNQPNALHVLGVPAHGQLPLQAVSANTHTYTHLNAHTDTLPSSRPPMVKASAADRMLLHVQRKTHTQLLDAHHCFSHGNYSQCCSHSRPPLKNTSWTTFLGTSLLIFMNLKALNAFVTTFFSSKFCSTLTTWNSPSSPISHVSSRLFFPTISYEMNFLFSSVWPESSSGAIKSYGKFLLRSECEEAECCFLLDNLKSYCNQRRHTLLAIKSNACLMHLGTI